MSKALVVVESPAKAKTLERYLGGNYQVLATYGHVRDLLPKAGAVDTENDFTMKYEQIEKSKKAVDAIVKALKKADILYLATDPDREGEAIAWHLYELLKERSSLRDKTVHRVVFHEVTKSAIEQSTQHPRDLSMELVNAQQARRALDYLVGFNLSPLLWKKIRRGLSAGRVQSPALRMIVEREEEIEKFIAREYWTVEADVKRADVQFISRLTHLAGEKQKQFSIENGEVAMAARHKLLQAAAGQLQVEALEKKQRKRQPAPPFITSTMQQEAIRKLGFTAQRAMRIAQQLYEGIDIGDGAVGLITYMRTDSVSLAEEAIQELRAFIPERYGHGKIPPHPRHYKTTSKNAQEAHEAIRPTSVYRTPQEIKSKLNHDQFKLYELIWKRTVACQMQQATIDTIAVDFGCGKGNIFRSTGSTITELGFMEVYLEGQDDTRQDGEQTTMLPSLQVGDVVQLLDIRAEQHFTEPPPRYTEASLVKSLEEYGIGRPSTYASIISTLLQREYVELDNKRFVPTDVGRIVKNFLTEHFFDYVDYEFTARLEDELDAVSRGEKEWIPLLHEFWVSFASKVKDKEENVSRKQATQARELGIDPASGLPVSVRMGRYGPYVQIGTREDSDKPRFAGLRNGQRMDSISFADALTLFKLPRTLGKMQTGDEVIANIGRFGPYVRYGNKFISLNNEDDPHTITLERALEVITEKQKTDAEREIKVFADAGISILNGRYGPYITDGKKNAKIPKDREPSSLSLEESRSLLAAAPLRRRRPGGKNKG